MMFRPLRVLVDPSGLPLIILGLRNSIRKVQVQQAEMECYKIRGIAHGRAHSRAQAEDQHRQAQQVAVELGCDLGCGSW